MVQNRIADNHQDNNPLLLPQGKPERRLGGTHVRYISPFSLSAASGFAKGSLSAKPGIVRRIPLEAAAQRRSIFGLDNPVDV